VMNACGVLRNALLRQVTTTPHPNADWPASWRASHLLEVLLRRLSGGLLAQAAKVIDAWQHSAPTAPDELAASLLMAASGEVEKPPLANVFGAMLGTESDTAELVARVGADPASAFHKRMSYRETKRYLAELGDAMAGEDDRLGEGSDDEPQGHPFSKSEYFGRPLPTEAIAALVDNFVEGRRGGQSRELDFTPWGGCLPRSNLRAPRLRQEKVRPRRLLPLLLVAPQPGSGKRCPGVMAHDEPLRFEQTHRSDLARSRGALLPARGGPAEGGRRLGAPSRAVK
jgi:hypothetical protein